MGIGKGARFFAWLAMEKYLILVKHSVPEIEEDRPAHTWRLSKEGRSRADRLAEELKDFAPEVITSSHEQKASETAEIIAKQLKLDLRIVPGLREHDRSNVPYLPHDAFEASIRELFQRPEEHVFGTETASEAHARFYRTVHSLLNEYRDKTIVIVSHGTVISLFVSRLTGSTDFELWKRLGLPSFVALDMHSSNLIVRSTIV
jgi:broad specificity phosphatase PhoE